MAKRSKDDSSGITSDASGQDFKLKDERWWKRVRAWYAQTSKFYRLFFWLAIAVIVVLVGEFLVQTGLSVQSLRNDDLVIYVSPANEAVTITHGQNATLSYELGVSNLPLCSAVCDWRITELGRNELLAFGTEELSTGVKKTYFTQATSRKGESSTVYQFTATCSAAKTVYCKSEAKDHEVSAVTLVHTTYTADEQVAYDSLVQNLFLWTENVSSTLALLRGVADLNDIRASAVSQNSQDDFYLLLERYSAVGLALSAHDVVLANNGLVYKEPDSFAQYAALREQERLLAEHLTSLRATQPLLNALAVVVNSTESRSLREAIDSLPLNQDEFNTQTLDETEVAYSSYNDLLAQLTALYEQQTVYRANTAQQLLYNDSLAACTIKAGPCPSPAKPVRSLLEAAPLLVASCSELANKTNLEAAQRTYEAQLGANLTHDELLALYNVSEVYARPDYPVYSQTLLFAARAGVLLTQNISERLAVSLQRAPEAVDFLKDNCTLSNATITAPDINVSASLPMLPMKNLSLPVLRLPKKECCSASGCNSCVSRDYPVLFVHGHSVSVRTSPEYSLETLLPVAHKLQEEGVTYMGTVFPREDLSSETFAEYETVPRMSFTTTYYYDSYIEQGKSSLVAQKSENIETYSIRLKEAIEVVKHKTGRDKVVLVAHSMGGLVSRRYMQIFGDDSVAALILVGTPNAGVSDKIESLCPVFGGNHECEDLARGSLFLQKLNSGRQPRVPVHVFAGRGCDGRDFDGIVNTESALLSWANNTLVDGACPSASELLHSKMLDPEVHPEVYGNISALVRTYSSH